MSPEIGFYIEAIYHLSSVNNEKIGLKISKPLSSSEISKEPFWISHHSSNLSLDFDPHQLCVDDFQICVSSSSLSYEILLSKGKISLTILRCVLCKSLKYTMFRTAH